MSSPEDAVSRASASGDLSRILGAVGGAPAIRPDARAQPPVDALSPAPLDDSLLQGILLAKEYIALHKGIVTTSAADAPGARHGEVVTSLVHQSAARHRPSYPHNIVDAGDVVVATADAKVRDDGDSGDTKHARRKNRSSSAATRHPPLRREAAHALRMAVALNPTFILPARERAVTPQQASSESISMSDRSSSSSSSSSHKNDDAALPTTASVEMQMGADKEKKKGGRARRRRSRRHTAVASSSTEIEMRNERGDAANRTVPTTTAGDKDATGHLDYLPDVDNAEQMVAERMHLLREGGADVPLTGAVNLFLDATRLVRRANRFHCGPVPSWLRVYSDVLFFCHHHLDREVVASVKSSREDSPRGRYRVGGNVKGVVQRPADAVLLQLRSDVARVRRLRDELSRNSNTKVPPLSCRDVYTARHEVYRPAEPNWGGTSSSPMADEAAGAGAAGIGDVEGEREAPLAVSQGPPSLRPPPPPCSAPPLSRSMEAKDLQRSLLAQTIPVWRRHGAAVKMLTELLNYLEDRLSSFEEQLEDPSHGMLWKLIGAPESAGVDGTAPHTRPPALERAIQATIRNTIMSDIFSTSWTALPNRGLRLSEAFSRRQTPCVHADYVTVWDARPLYDSTMLQTVRSGGGAATATAAAAMVGVDTRRSYSVHVDYVRFEPSLERVSYLGALGIFTGAERSGATAAAAISTSAADNSSVGRSSTLSDTMDLLSSLLLGSYTSVLFPCDVAATENGAAADIHAALNLEQQRRDRSLQESSTALLLALSAASTQHGLIGFNPEEYIISSLLKYYEQYRLLQLNLLPVLKNHLFYREQVQQLQRQSQRNSDVDDLQRRLESLERTAAMVERGFLHAMILLWNSVLMLRRQQSRQGPRGAEKVDAGTADEPPIIVEGRHSGNRGKHRKQERRSDSARRRGHHHLSATTADSLEPKHGQQLDETQIGASSVVHRVNHSIVQDDVENVRCDGVGIASASHEHDNRRTSSPHSASLFSASPLGQRHRRMQRRPSASATTSRLLATITPHTSGESNSRLSCPAGHGDDEGAGGEAAPPPSPPPQGQGHHRRFRFFLRRCGTFDETPYVVGDDLLDYAAEVEGTDVLVSSSPSGVGGDTGGGGSETTEAEAASPMVPRDELMYFQLVVFTRSRAAMVPQYVGCTTPRPMTSARVVFFNETFEVRTLREPAELLLHLIPILDGPSKHTVVSTVRLRPTLTRTYSLLPLQPPTAFFFNGRLYARHQQVAPSSQGTAAASTAVQGVLAVSTTWTSSEGMTIPRIERLFLRGGGNTGIAADPLDPQYLPLLRMLRAYYQEEDMHRTRTAGSVEAHSASRRGRTAEKARRSDAAARGVTFIRPSHDDAGSSAGDRHAHPGIRRARSAVAALEERAATLSRVGERLLRSRSLVAMAERGRGAVGASASKSQATEATPLPLRDHVSIDHYAVKETLERLPDARLRHLHRRWLIQVDRIKAASEVEARLFARPMALDEEDTYALLKTLKRTVGREEADWLRVHGEATAANFNLAHYYSAPSAISGLMLSPLSSEAKRKLWQERQRRLLLTLKARHQLTDAEKYEAVVRVPKLAPKRVFDFTPRSQLNPHRKMRPKTEHIDRALLARRHDSRIVIHIMKAHNLPLRADGTPLEPFMEASFVSEAAYTRSEVGSNPSWFESLDLPFQPLNFEEETLGMIDDDVIISLYDKVEVQMAPSTSTMAAVAHETHYRTERRFIGTLHIPFYALHEASQARIEGVYPLHMPRWLLGYDTLLPYSDGVEGEAAGHRVLPGGALGLGTATPASNPFGGVERLPEKHSEESSASLRPVTPSAGTHRQTIEPTVQLYMSLWPPLQREPPPGLSPAELSRKVAELIVSPQLRYLHHVALRWQQAALKAVRAIGKINAQASTRLIEPFVRCSTGDVMLLCRYLLPRGGPPPPSVRTVYEAIRYVSLVPLVTNMMSYGDKGVWGTNAELLVMRSGDYEELAMLLVHFLRHLAPNRPTYAVLGSGTICKRTVLVLHAFDHTEWVLIDPRSGRMVSVGKPYGTALRDVYMVISHDQLWANVQLSGFPHRMTWDLSNRAHWLPCFDRTKDKHIALCAPHLFPIQREVNIFSPSNPVKAREVELELRGYIKKALMTWRNGCPPAYHRGVETILRTLLVASEEERCTCGTSWRSDITLSAAARLSEYFGENVTGEPGNSNGAAKPKRRRHRNSRHRSASTSPRHDDDDADEHTRAEDITSPQPETAAAAAAVVVPSSVRPLRLIGSPVMGSYNPCDPQFHELLQNIFECAVHEVSTNEVSFAIATYVKSYTSDVCAMWAFVVAICRG